MALRKRHVVVSAGLAAALVLGVVVAVGSGEAAGQTPRDCALAWNRTAGPDERDLLNKDAQVARGPDKERRVGILVTVHRDDDERFTRLDGGPGVARLGVCLVVGKLGMTFVQRPTSGWQVTQAQSIGPLGRYVKRVVTGESNAYVEAPIAGLEKPTPRDGLILGVDG
jgi:hypothetical protein